MVDEKVSGGNEIGHGQQRTQGAPRSGRRKHTEAAEHPHVRGIELQDVAVNTSPDRRGCGRENSYVNAFFPLQPMGKWYRQELRCSRAEEECVFGEAQRDRGATGREIGLAPGW